MRGTSSFWRANAVFVVVVRLDQPEESKRHLLYWLRFIKNRMSEKPKESRRPTVILVGSCRDAVGENNIFKKGSAEGHLVAEQSKISPEIYV